MPSLPKDSPRSCRLIGLVVASILLGGCEPASSPPASPGEDQRPGPRVVSLSPALTQALLDLGAEELLVGRTPSSSVLQPSITFPFGNCLR